MAGTKTRSAEGRSSEEAGEPHRRARTSVRSGRRRSSRSVSRSFERVRYYTALSDDRETTVNGW